PADIMFGTALGAGQLNATADVAGTMAYAPASGTILAIGQHTLAVTFTPADTLRYDSATATVAIVVRDPNHAPLLVNPGTQVSGIGAAFAHAVSVDAPVAYWRLGGLAGATADDSAGTSPATIVGGITRGQPGALADGSRAMAFDGSTGYLSAPGPAASLAGD